MRFGVQQKHLQRILDMYDSAFAGVSENRLLLVQEVDNDGTFPYTIPVMVMITLLCAVKRMSMVRGRAWKRSVTQAREAIAGQTAGLKVWILYGVQRRQLPPGFHFRKRQTLANTSRASCNSSRSKSRKAGSIICWRVDWLSTTQTAGIR
jgi:hypothetical protein